MPMCRKIRDTCYPCQGNVQKAPWMHADTKPSVPLGQHTRGFGTSPAGTPIWCGPDTSVLHKVCTASDTSKHSGLPTPRICGCMGHNRPHRPRDDYKHHIHTARRGESTSNCLHPYKPLLATTEGTTLEHHGKGHRRYSHHGVDGANHTAGNHPHTRPS